MIEEIKLKSIVSIDKVTTWFKTFLKWLILDFFCFRLIWEKIRTTRNEDGSIKSPSNFLFWLLGAYVAIYGIAAERYESRVDIIELRANSVLSQLGTNNYKKALEQIPNIQRMECLARPNFLDPSSVFSAILKREFSLTGNWDSERVVHEDIVYILKETAMIWKDSLSRLNLEKIDLSKVDFGYSANLNKATINNADYTKSVFRNAEFIQVTADSARFDSSYIIQSIFSEAKCRFCNFEYATLTHVSFRYADLTHASFLGATLEDVDFTGVRTIEPKQLAEANKLQKIKVDPWLLQKTQQEYPELVGLY